MEQRIDDLVRLALLIDADNVAQTFIPDVVEVIEQKAYGRLVVRRAYQNWSIETLKAWQPMLAAYSIEPMRVFSGERGPNASDIELAVDAMDLLYTRAIDAFCIVSGDGDFTRLAYRLRESGMRVVGFGVESKSAESLRRACDEFHAIGGSPASPAAETPPVLSGAGKTAADVICDILRNCDDRSIGLPLTELGKQLRQRGAAKSELKKFIETELLDSVEIVTKTARSGTGDVYYARLKRPATKPVQRAAQAKPTAGRGPAPAVSPAPSPPGKDPP